MGAMCKCISEGALQAVIDLIQHLLCPPTANHAKNIVPQLRPNYYEQTKLNKALADAWGCDTGFEHCDNRSCLCGHGWEYIWHESVLQCAKHPTGELLTTNSY